MRIAKGYSKRAQPKGKDKGHEQRQKTWNTDMYMKRNRRVNMEHEQIKFRKIYTKRHAIGILYIRPTSRNQRPRNALIEVTEMYNSDPNFINYVNCKIPRNK